MNKRSIFRAFFHKRLKLSICLIEDVCADARFCQSLIATAGKAGFFIAFHRKQIVFPACVIASAVLIPTAIPACMSQVYASERIKQFQKGGKRRFKLGSRENIDEFTGGKLGNRKLSL